MDAASLSRPGCLRAGLASPRPARASSPCQWGRRYHHLAAPPAYAARPSVACPASSSASASVGGASPTPPSPPPPGAGARAAQLRAAGVPSAHHAVAARALDLAERSAEWWDVPWTDFLSVPERLDCERAVAKHLGDGVVALEPRGGYPGAERCRLAVGRPEALAGEDAGSGVALVCVEGNFLFDEATHRDFLGAVLGAGGIVRGKVGDILVDGDRGAQVRLALCPAPRLAPKRAS